MKLGVIVNEAKRSEETLERLQAESLSIVLAGNGVYHGVAKENGKASSVLDRDADYYVLTEDLESRGFTTDDLVDSKIKPIGYEELVDLIMERTDKFVWL